MTGHSKLARLTALLLLLPGSGMGQAPSPKAIERYKQMLADNPVEGVALDRLWASASEGGGVEQLLAEYRAQKTFGAQMVLGHLLRKAARVEEAIAAYAQAASLEPKSPLPALARARLENARNRPADAAVQFAAAAALLPETDPARVQVAIDLGKAWLAAGEAAKAAAAWERAVAAEPQNLDLRRQLAATYADNLLPEQAIKHLEAVAEQGAPGDRTQALQQIARLYSASGHPGEAMQVLEKAVAQTAPGNWLRSEMLGQIIRIAQRQRVEGELEQKWKRQVEENPRDLSGYLQMVEFYERTGDLDKERDWLEKVSALVPKNDDIRLKLARLHVQMDRVDLAVPLYDAMISAQPGNTDIVFERARLDLQREDGAAARKRITELLANRKGDDALRAKAVEFFKEHHLHDVLELQLKADAATRGMDEIFALADFYFSQRKLAEATATLNGLVREKDTPERRAEVLVRIAQTFKAQGEVAPALKAVEAAIKERPNVREHHLLLGELLQAGSLFSDARNAFQKAYDLSKTDADRQEADNRAFQSIREEFTVPAEGAGTGGRPRKQERLQAAVEEHIRKLMADARAANTVRAWLRVAQWKAWNGDKASAVTFASKASDVDSKDPAPHEFQARLATLNGDASFAIEHYRQLLQLNPANGMSYLREMAKLQLDRGNVSDALAAYTELARANPGDGTALADLARAQERARKVEEAVGTWRKAIAILPKQRSREASASLLRLLRELGRHEEATTMLLASMEEMPDDRERLAQFDELLLYCQQHGRMDWLRAKFEERRKLRADDYFTAVALGRILKVLGEKGAAFELFADAALSAPNQSEALPELIREAEEMQRLDTAVRLQEQLTRVAPQEGPDAFIKLATLCEKTGDLEGAERSWTRAVGKFPRDLEVNRQAAEFHRQWGDLSRAALLWRRCVALDPANPRLAASQGALDFELGNLEEARPAFEAVMRLTRPIEQWIYPDERGARREGPARAAERRGASPGYDLGASRSASYGMLQLPPDQEMRLNALRRLSEIASRRGGPDFDKAVAEWTSSPLGTESMWALYFMGARGKLLDAIERKIASEPGESTHRRAWLRIGLESWESPRLADWLHNGLRTAPELDLFSECFVELLGSHPQAISERMLSALLPANSRVRVSQTAFALMNARRWNEALPLAERVYAIAGVAKASIGREIARARFATGNPEAGLRVLAEAAAQEGDGFESAAYEAMREYLRVAPEEARKAFVSERLAATSENSLHGCITRVVLHGVMGDEAEAMKALERLIEMRPRAPYVQKNDFAAREWAFRSTAVAFLENSGLPSLARRVSDLTFADEGWVSVISAPPKQPRLILEEEDPSTSLESRVGAARLMHQAQRFLAGGRAERVAIMEELRKTERGVERLADQLSAFSARDAVVEASLYAWEQSFQNRAATGTTDPFALRRLLDACIISGDEVTAEAVRKRVLDEKLATGSDSTPGQFARELSEQYEHRGDLQRAVQIVTSTQATFPDEQLAIRNVELLFRSGATSAAEAELRTLLKSGNGGAMMNEQLAAMLERRGKLHEAIAVRTRAGGGADPRLPLLLYQSGQVSEARMAMERLPASFAVNAAMTLAEAMGLAGDFKGARSVLISTASRVSEPKAQLQLRSKLLKIPGNPPTPEFALRMQARMRSSVAAQPDLTDAYYQYFDRYATAFGIGKEWAEEATRAWRDGAGPIAAGVSVLSKAAEAGDDGAARKACEALAARPDLTESLIERANSALKAAQRDDLTLILLEANARRNAFSLQPALRWVRALRESGKGEKAREELNKMHWLVIAEGGPGLLAREWLELGDTAKAREYAELALRDESVNPSAPTLALMARVQAATKRLDAARILLKRAFSFPSCREFDALSEYLDLSGQLGSWRKFAAEWNLAPAKTHGLRLSIFARLERLERASEAFAFLESEPGLVTPFSQDGQVRGVGMDRVRMLARKTGAFEKAAGLLNAPTLRRQPGAVAELSALEADRLEAGGASPLAALEKAHKGDPRRWEFARRYAEALLANKERSKAYSALLTFLNGPGVWNEREAAFQLLDKCR